MMKKGAIQLSTTAIVSMILAFVFLGLVISFTRSIIGKGEEVSDNFWYNLDLDQPATANKPLLFPKEVTITKGKDQPFGIRVYNKLPDTLKNAKPVIGSCTSSSDEDVGEGKIIFATPATNIGSGKEHGFEGFLTLSEDIDPGNYVCLLYITADGFEDVGYVSELGQGNLKVTVAI